VGTILTSYLVHSEALANKKVPFTCLRRILFIYSLFNDSASSSDYIASNGRIISELWIGKDMEGSGRGLTRPLEVSSLVLSPPGLSKSVALPCRVRPPMGQPTKGLATHGAGPPLGPPPPWENHRDAPHPRPYFAAEQGLHHRSFIKLAFPQHCCSLLASCCVTMIWDRISARTAKDNSYLGSHYWNNDLRDVAWRTPLECQCTPKRTPFRSYLSYGRNHNERGYCTISP
jgi:hypothetical protein